MKESFAFLLILGLVSIMSLSCSVFYAVRSALQKFVTDNNSLQTEKMAIIRSVGKRDRSVPNCSSKFHQENE